MIVETNTREITRSQDFEETQFKINISAKVMEILYSKIYSNKPLAVLRETAANMSDANKEAGKGDIPIEVTLPSVLEPTLKIRDCGNSMDHNTVMTLYATYGLSTKGESNEFIGAYGIGKFAPFSYSSSFQLSCIQNGIKRIYNMYLDESSIGKIALLSESPTDEQNGTEVLIPIKNEDISTFVDTAESLFQFWEPKPRVIGNSDYTNKETEYTIRGDYWAFIKNHSYYDSAYVVMGGVPYKLNKQSIPNIEYGTAKHNILSKAVIFYAKIGDVNVNAGREELEYTEKTIKFVNSRLELIESEAKKQIEDKIAAAKTEFEVRELYYNFFSSYGSMGSILTDILKNANYKLNFNNQVIDNYRFSVFGKVTAAYESSLENQYKRRKGYIQSLGTAETCQLDIFHILANEANKDLTFDKFFYYIETDVNGVKKEITREKIVSLLGYYSKSQFSKPLLGNHFLTVCFETQEKYDNWIAEIGISNTFFKNIIETIKLPPPAPKIRKPRVSSGETRTYPADIYNDGDWKEVQVDIKAESGYYVTRFYSNRYLNYQSPKLDDIGQIIINSNINNDDKLCGNALYFLRQRELMPDDKIYSFTPKYVEKLDKSKWIPLEIYVKLALEEYNKTNNVDVIPMTKISLSSGPKKLFNWIKSGKFEVDSDHPLKEVINNTAEKEIEFQNYSQLNNHFGFKLESYDAAKIEKYQSLINKEYKKFPLLDNGYWYNYDEYNKEYLLYLNAKYSHLKELEAEKAAKKAKKELVGA